MYIFNNGSNVTCKTMKAGSYVNCKTMKAGSNVKCKTMKAGYEPSLNLSHAISL